MYTPGAGHHRSPAAAAGGPPSGAASASSSTSSAPTPNSFAAHPFWLGPQPPSHGSHAPFPQPHPPTYYMPHQQPPQSYGYQHQAQAVMTSPAAMYPTMACPPAPGMTSQGNSLPLNHEQDDAIDEGEEIQWEYPPDECAVCVSDTRETFLFKPCCHYPFCRLCVGRLGVLGELGDQIICPHCKTVVKEVLDIKYCRTA